MSSDRFSPLEIDAIGEILNISLGASATAVSSMLSKRVDITTPRVKVLTAEEFEFTNLEPAIGVEITYVAGLKGTNVMLLKRSDVKAIVEILMMTEIPDEEFELNEMNLSAICEVMNMMMGASATALSEFLGEMVDISTPISFPIEDVEGFKKERFHGNEKMVIISFDLKIEDTVESEFMNMMPVSLAKKLVAAFGVPIEDEEETSKDNSSATLTKQETKQAVASQKASESAANSSGGTLSQEEIEKLMGGGTATTPQPQPTAQPATNSSGGTLSQEEIEKLMGGGTATTPQPQPVPQPTPQPAPTMPQATMSPDMMQQMMNT